MDRSLMSLSLFRRGVSPKSKRLSSSSNIEHDIIFIIQSGPLNFSGDFDLRLPQRLLYHSIFAVWIERRICLVSPKIPVSFNQAVGATTLFFTALFAYLMTLKREA
ncbi:hypothetical protein Bca4012_036238 [Brassica carinata]|uniref:Uncharacterized protein n=1 Tax=Brassica carinata TaxID=52824 RepID=A0A8X7VT72_BRACI|nr:hypothetical protein Bca52824_020083 [Brassica carinata]